MLPAGVATSTPSHMSSSRRVMPSTAIRMWAAWRLWRISDTSLMARASVTAPSPVLASITRGCKVTVSAAARRAGRSSSPKRFMRKPTVPQFMPKIGTARSRVLCSVSSMKPSPPRATITSAVSGGART